MCNPRPGGADVPVCLAGLSLLSLSSFATTVFVCIHESDVWHPLWKDRNLQAIREAGLDVIHNYPKHSPDFNAIENWWHRLWQKLEDNAPTTLERREDFIRRLRRTVSWLNENCSDDALF